MKVCALTCVCVDVFDASGEIRPGGEALNFIANCSSYPHANCFLIGAIGGDSYGEVVKVSIREKPIDTSHLYTLSGVTASNITYLTQDGDRYYKPESWTGGVYQDFKLTQSDRELLCSADIVHTSIMCPIFDEILKLKHKAGFKLAVDFNRRRDFDEWESFIGDIDFFFISGDDLITPRLEAWSQLHSGIFIATLAERGSIAFHRGKMYSTSAIMVQNIVDTTGCGDSYQAGFIASYYADDSNEDILAAMQEGSRVASQTLGHFGGFN